MPTLLIGLMSHSKFALLEPGIDYTSSQELQASRAPQPRRKAVESSAAHCRFRPSITILSVKNCCGPLLQVDRTAMFCKCPSGTAWKITQKLYPGRRCKNGDQFLYRSWKAGGEVSFRILEPQAREGRERLDLVLPPKEDFFSGSKGEEWA